MSAFEEQRSGSDYTARQSCVPADPDRCYRVVPGHLSVVTTTDLAHVPGADDADVVRLRVEDGAVVSDAVAA